MLSAIATADSAATYTARSKKPQGWQVAGGGVLGSYMCKPEVCVVAAPDIGIQAWSRHDVQRTCRTLRMQPQALQEAWGSNQHLVWQWQVHDARTILAL
jgi:hypothetical protein